MFVYKFSVQGNLYLVRYKQLKFPFQGKFWGKLPQQTAQIVIAVYENIPYGMRF